jgi:class 3 adenylate cyclase
LKTYHYEWRWQASASPEQLWPLLANTDRTNSEGGLPALHMVAAGEAQSGVVRTGFSSLGVAVEWEEGPSEWVYPRWYTIRRKYTRGPFAQWLCRVELRPGDAGTEIAYSADMEPSGALGHLVIPVQIGQRLKRMLDKLFTHYFEIAANQSATHISPQLKQPAVDNARLSALTAQLSKSAPAAARLAALIRESDDHIAARLRPYELAPALRLSRPAVLELFLNATRLGMLDLQWDILCPRCRGAKETQLALADLSTTVHCDACQIDFSAHLPQQVELTFRPNPAVRKVEAETYCVGGPMRSPHVFIQQVLNPGETREVQFALPEGSYRLRTFEVIAGAEAECRVAGDGRHQQHVTLTEHGFDASGLALAPRSRLKLTNSTSRPRTILLEGTAWRSDALTAAEVLTKQVFRDLFSRELLRPGENISVGTLTVVFTDLRGSTALYREIGDAPAFGRVLDHFAVIRVEVERAGGAVVKTMGDAVLAVFQSPRAAIDAMLQAQQLLRDAGLMLKVGIHSGPCIAVTLNERLDYFGTTMNLSARLAGLSDGSDIVVTQNILDDLEVSAAGRKAEPIFAEVKGLDELPAIWRIGRSNTGNLVA